MRFSSTIRLARTADTLDLLNRVDSILNLPVSRGPRKLNLARQTMTAQFYRQDALSGLNLTQRGANLDQLRVTLQ